MLHSTIDAPSNWCDDGVLYLVRTCVSGRVYLRGLVRADRRWSEEIMEMALTWFDKLVNIDFEVNCNRFMSQVNCCCSWILCNVNRWEMRFIKIYVRVRVVVHN